MLYFVKKYPRRHNWYCQVHNNLIYKMITLFKQYDKRCKNKKKSRISVFGNPASQKKELKTLMYPEMVENFNLSILVIGSMEVPHFFVL